MKRFLFIGLFILLSALTNSGSDIIKIGIIEEQSCRLQEIVNKQIAVDKYLSELGVYDKFTLEDKSKVNWICDSLGIKDQKWLYKVFLTESRANTKAVNKHSRAVGIIQFLPSTARKLGTTTKELYNMSMNEQLDYVYKYFKPICKKHNIDSYFDMYLAVFYPMALGKSDNHVIGHKYSKIVAFNNSIDFNNDGTITVRELRSKCM